MLSQLSYVLIMRSDNVKSWNTHQFLDDSYDLDRSFVLPNDQQLNDLDKQPNDQQLNDLDHNWTFNTETGLQN